jgi:D-glycerate 3-kinase
MEISRINYKKIKKRYLKFLSSQEVMSEPFRDKLGQLDKFYLPISKMIKKEYIKKKKTQIIGLTGGQGTGKSTISNILKIILKEAYKLETVIFSIDDFYKTLKERKKMSKKLSTLFLTRGVPGTHDTRMLFQCIKDLKNNNFKRLTIPSFDKSIDDRTKKSKWLKVKKKPNIVIFEGWCVGATAQKNKDLNSSINKLEKDKDKKKIWRKRVNTELKKNYKKIFELIDKLIFLRVPSFKYVFEWRLLQEKKLKITSKGNKIMTNRQIKNFIMYYERLTKHMLKTLPKKADTIISIDKKHMLKSIKFN